MKDLRQQNFVRHLTLCLGLISTPQLCCSVEREVGAPRTAADTSSYGLSTRFPSTTAGQGCLLEAAPAGFTLVITVF